MSPALVLVAVLALAGWPTCDAYPVPADGIAFWKMVTSLGASIYGQPSELTGELLKKYSPDSGVNPEELGEYTQGDILFTNKGAAGSALARNGLKAPSARWPGAVVPFEISYGFPQADRQMILNAMEEYHKHTCIRFVPRRGSDVDYLYITNGNTGCWSSVGRVGGRQEVNLQTPGCLTKIGTPMHELMHAMGFMHEQNRWERDDYVTINWQHIQSGRNNNFDKADASMTDGQGVNYDYRSVMHYSSKAFSRDGSDTITARVGGVSMGQRSGFSRGDLKKLRHMYKCEGGKSKL
ncbi:zinc metalloproteinase nas-13-like isoform X2 [Frankliniella occidentalis]|uniref:Metalloendopeptidase n=1 Tax=Frankliniella occidentalis TaxID=133901 RepID=A0A6J1RRN8_FRAOC|nr:zinc metalloproteinase nas-13-like isoform X2 [Frankliniella occidentalis]